MQTSVSELGNPTLQADIGLLSDALGCRIDLFCEGAMVGIVVCDFELPAGIYNKSHSDVLLQATTQYPASEMDMFWVDQDLALADGRLPSGGESIETHFGRQWRRYSWHRNTPWRPGRDSVLTHFEFALARLQRPE